MAWKLGWKIYSGEYSFGESIILLWHRRERESAISLSTPGMNSSEKLNSLNAMYHRTITGLEASVMNNKFRWSVLIVKRRSRRSDCKYIQEKNIPYASFWITDLRSWDLLRDLLTKATGCLYHQLSKINIRLHHNLMHQCVMWLVLHHP